jgi:hypothetical protein
MLLRFYNSYLPSDAVIAKKIIKTDIAFLQSQEPVLFQTEGTKKQKAFQHQCTERLFLLWWAVLESNQ